MSPEKKIRNKIIAAIIIITVIISIFMFNIQSEKNKLIKIIKTNEVQKSIKEDINFWEEESGLKPGSYIKKWKILYDSVWTDGGGRIRFNIVCNDNDENNDDLYLDTALTSFISENEWGEIKIKWEASVIFPKSIHTEMRKIGEKKNAK